MVYDSLKRPFIFYVSVPIIVVYQLPAVRVEVAWSRRCCGCARVSFLSGFDVTLDCCFYQYDDASAAGALL